jgi:hypothetical protein
MTFPLIVPVLTTMSLPPARSMEPLIVPLLVMLSLPVPNVWIAPAKRMVLQVRHRHRKVRP